MGKCSAHESVAFDQFNRLCALRGTNQIVHTQHGGASFQILAKQRGEPHYLQRIKSIKLTSKLKNQLFKAVVSIASAICVNIVGSCISVSCKNDGKHAETADSQMSVVLQWTRHSGSSDKYPVPVQPYYAWLTDVKPNFTVYWVVGWMERDGSKMTLHAFILHHRTSNASAGMSLDVSNMTT